MVYTWNEKESLYQSVSSIIYVKEKSCAHTNGTYLSCLGLLKEPFLFLTKGRVLHIIVAYRETVNSLSWAWTRGKRMAIILY